VQTGAWNICRERDNITMPTYCVEKYPPSNCVKFVCQVIRADFTLLLVSAKKKQCPENVSCPDSPTGRNDVDTLLL